MDNIPSYVPGVFIAIVITVLSFIVYAIIQTASKKKSSSSLLPIIILSAWIVMISSLAINNYFLDYSSPPRLLFFLAGPLLCIALLLILPKSRIFLLRMPLTTLHYIHIVRVPVEVVLWWLSIELLIPQEMTFEGKNLDIIAGISAPFAAVFMTGNQRKSRLVGVIWNLISPGLLMNIVVRAISLTPYFFSPRLTEIANTGIFHFPYILLPNFVVPIVLFSHVVSLYQLLYKSYERQF